MKVGYGESREVGRTLTAIAKEVHLSGNPVNPPCAPIAGGGTGIKVPGTDYRICYNPGWINDAETSQKA